MNFVDSFLAFEGVVAGLEFVFLYIIIFSPAIMKINKCRSTADQKDCATRLVQKYPTVMTSVMKFLLNDVKLLTRQDSSLVVVVYGFILEPFQVFTLVLTTFYYGFAFLLIVIRNSVIKEETIYSACFSGAKLSNGSSSCMIFRSDYTDSELTSEDCTDFFFNEPNWFRNDYQILCLQSTPNVLAALAGIAGLVQVTRGILFVYGSIVFRIASIIKQQPANGKTHIFSLIPGPLFFNVIFIIGIVVYHVTKKSEDMKAWMYYIEANIYVLGLFLIMYAIPWQTAQRYKEQEEQLEQDNIKSPPFIPLPKNQHTNMRNRSRPQQTQYAQL